MDLAKLKQWMGFTASYRTVGFRKLQQCEKVGEINLKPTVEPTAAG